MHWSRLGFVFSVVDNAEADVLRNIYRGTATAAPSCVRFPRPQVNPLVTARQRGDADGDPGYVRERVQHRFGIYAGGAKTGQIAELTSMLKPLSNDDIDAGGPDLESGDHVEGL